MQVGQDNRFKGQEQKRSGERMYFGDAVERLRVRVRHYLQEEIY